MPSRSNPRNPAPRSRKPGTSPASILTEFIKPLTAESGRPTVRQVEAALTTAVAIWNGVVLEDARLTRKPLAELRRNVEGAGDAGLKRLLEVLVDRKRRLYPNERWVVDSVEVIEEEGRIRIQVERRSPRQGGRPGGRDRSGRKQEGRGRRGGGSGRSR